MPSPSEAAAPRVGPPPHAKGPRVFLDYDQVELDAAYTQIAYAPNAPQIIKRFTSSSQWSLAGIGPAERISYGPSEIEQLDIYRCHVPNAPILMFIHGGGWRLELAKDFVFPGETFVKSGAHYVVPDFAWVQDVGGKLLPLADQVRRAVAWVYHNAAYVGGDRRRIHVVGQSSGAHLASVLLTTDWNALFDLPADLIKGGVCISGMYDLKPVRLSSRSSYVIFDDETENALSAIRHVDRLHAPMIVAYGSLETPEFQRQGRDFAAAITDAGKEAQLLVGEHYNHFEYLETLMNPWSPLSIAILRQMGLQPP